MVEVPAKYITVSEGAWLASTLLAISLAIIFIIQYIMQMYITLKNAILIRKYVNLINYLTINHIYTQRLFTNLILLYV